MARDTDDSFLRSDEIASELSRVRQRARARLGAGISPLVVERMLAKLDSNPRRRRRRKAR